MQLYITLVCVLIVFLSEDEALWLKQFAEINTTHNTVVLTGFYFILFLQLNTTGR